MRSEDYLRIISRLDIKDGNLVKGIQLEGLRALGDVNFFSEKYYKDNVDEIFYQDCVASLYGNNMLHNLISKASRSIFIPLTVGGGIRNIADIKSVLKAGADKVSINTAAIKNINFVKDAVQIFGSSTISISIEANKLEDGQYYCFTESGRNNTGKKVEDWVLEIQQYGIGEIILTMVNFDGTGEGFDINFIKKISNKTSVPLVIHGGCGDKSQIFDLYSSVKIDGVALASILHYDSIKMYQYPQNQKNLNTGNFDFLEQLNRVNKKINSSSIEEIKKYLVKQKINCRIC